MNLNKISEYWISVKIIIREMISKKMNDNYEITML